MKKMGALHPASLFERRKSDEEGSILLEIIIAMFIIALLTVAALPLMMQSIKITSQNTTATAANQRLLKTIEEARVIPVTCVRLQSMVGTKTYNDGRGINYTISFSLPNNCTVTANAQNVKVRIVATKVPNNIVLTSLDTNIFVPGTAI